MDEHDAEASIQAAQTAFLSWRHTTGKVTRDHTFHIIKI